MTLGAWTWSFPILGFLALPPPPPAPSATAPAGEFSQRGTTMPFTLTWTGEARLEAPPFDGDMKDGQPSGTWAQGTATMPLVLTRSQK